jgi:hypothetical protein
MRFYSIRLAEKLVQKDEKKAFFLAETKQKCDGKNRSFSFRKPPLSLWRSKELFAPLWRSKIAR